MNPIGRVYRTHFGVLIVPDGAPNAFIVRRARRVGTNSLGEDVWEIAEWTAGCAEPSPDLVGVEVRR